MNPGAGSSPIPLLLGMVLAPLVPGLINRVKARMAGRDGPPLLQLYFDLARLIRKGAVYGTVTTSVFRLGPAVSAAGAIASLAAVPLGRTPAWAGFAGDFVLFAGLLAAGRFATMLAALDTGSSFEGMGASREAAIGAAAEPGLLLALAAVAKVTGSLSLSGMAAASGPSASAPALGLAASAILLIMLAENARMPVDDPTTHLELTMIHEVQVLDHSGPDLALIEYGAAVKLWAFAALVAGVVLPAFGGGAVRLPHVLAAIAAVGVAVGLVESVQARLRLDRVPQLLATAAACGLVALALALRSGS